MSASLLTGAGAGTAADAVTSSDAAMSANAITSVNAGTGAKVATSARVLTGVGVGRGAAVGSVARVQPAPTIAADAAVVAHGRTLTGDELVARVEQAFAQVALVLTTQAAAATATVAEVLRATALMASDSALRGKVTSGIAGGAAPVAAIDDAVSSFSAMFTAAGGYLAERVTDLASVRDRVVAILLDLPVPGVPVLTGPSIVVARDLAPADTAALDLTNVVGIVTELGGPTSHTAIIAGQLGIPCVVRVDDAMGLLDGAEVAIDAAAGRVTSAPDADTRDAVAARTRLLAALEQDTAAGATSCGHAVALLANIGTVDDAVRVAATPAEGVGLFRTEVLFLERTTAPTLDEQADVYGNALVALAGRKLVVRTLDAGADKPLAFATQPGEENPALGVRGYRLVRSHPELVDTQLAALALAARRTGIQPWVMAPMIATPVEAREWVTRARAHGLETVGVMVEVPSAALRAKELLAEVDFVSLGTNDLAQYTMATDRLRGELADLLSPWQPAVLDLVAATTRAGQAANKPVGVCGESAGDPLMALVLVGLGATSLSMSGGSLAAVRYALRRHSRAQCVAMGDAALAASSAPDARQAVLALLDPEVRLGLGLAE